MTTAMIDLSESEEILEFSGSSEEDAAFAKTFWQSFSLFPPLESRLVSSDIHQRLKRAPTGSQSVNMINVETNEPQKNKDFMTRALLEVKAEEMARNAKLTDLRYADKARLHRHRHDRIEKEKISRRVLPKEKLFTSQDTLADEQELEDATVMIEEFERQKWGSAPQSDGEGEESD